MNDFPDFMKNPKNLIDAGSQHTRDVEGYVFDGADGSQMAFWTCRSDRVSSVHAHDYDEYLVVVQGRYILGIDGRRIPLEAGQEYLIPKNVPHGGEAVAGTRTIHAFGGRRARRAGERA